ncbi:TPA: hypothetical protein ACGY8I_004473 [Aeromonas hydrophila]|uniref:AbiTii domain-containing protein n=1 Tax=Aeromonas hydrophila TaxID=644 RepID=UPI0037329604
MPALIPELIAMATDPSIKTSALLRKALVAARLLQQPEWATWIGYELQGYPDEIELPLYRQMRCELKARVPGRGLIPILFNNPQEANIYTWCRCGQPIGPLEEVVIPGNNLSFSLAADAAVIMMQELQISMVPERVVGANQVRALIDAVRDKLLTWALDLAEAGIQGEGMTFTPQEQQQAQQVAGVVFNIGGNVHGFQFMQNSPGGQQQQTVTSEQKDEALAALLPWLQQVIDEGKLSPPVQAELQANQTALQALANAPTRSWPVIGTLASSVRAILEGAGGGVLAAQALGWLATLSGN